jgi:hypothetical protein
MSETATATFPHAVVEMALGHQVGNAVERAYRRTDLIEQRRQLLKDWASACEPKAENVVAFTKRPLSA